MKSGILQECVFWTDLTFPSISKVQFVCLSICLSVHLLMCPDQDKFPLHAPSCLLESCLELAQLAQLPRPPEARLLQESSLTCKPPPQWV